MTDEYRLARRGALTAALAIALSGLAAPGAASAAVGDPAAARAATVTIPFAPTIGKPIRLHTEARTVVVRGGVEAPREESTIDDELIFTERKADGYVLRWTTRAATVRTAPEKQALMEKVLSASIDKSQLIQTDLRGAPVALLNAAEVRAMMTSAFDGMLTAFDAQNAGKPQAEADAGRKALVAMAQSYRTATDEQLGAASLKEARMLFGFGGDVFTRGSPVTSRTMATMPIANAPVALTRTVALRDAGPGELTLAVSTVSDPQAVKAALATIMQTALAGMEPSRRDQMTAVIDRLQDFQTAEEMLLTLDARTGVIRRATHTRRVSVSGQSQAATEIFTAVE